jgi:hypothetical protein
VMGFTGQCSACGHAWHVLPPDRLPMPIGTALRLMESAYCPRCGNDGLTGRPLRFRSFADQPPPIVERPAPICATGGV